MLFAKYRDFEPMDEHKGYILSRTIHDDGDCIKWDWEIWKFVEKKEYEDSPIVHDMCEMICSLDLSPYERNQWHITETFKKQADLIFAEEHWSEGDIFS